MPRRFLAFAARAVKGVAEVARGERDEQGKGAQYLNPESRVAPRRFSTRERAEVEQRRRE